MLVHQTTYIGPCKLHYIGARLNQVIVCLFIVEQQQLMNRHAIVVNQSESTSARLMLYRRTLAKMHPGRDSVDFHQLTCCTAVQPLHRRQTGFSGFRRQLLEQSSTTRDVCALARNTQTVF